MHSEKLYGLVLTGGKSTRMQKDKSCLEYHGRKQSVVCYFLLDRFCDEVFLSNRKDQADLDGHSGYPQIHDHEEFKDMGPLSGILSAMNSIPAVAWLVLACDMPYINETTIKDLIQQRDPRKVATAYHSAHDRKPEPLCAIYEPHARPVLLDYIEQKIYCPRQILMLSDVYLIDLKNKQALDNINHPSEYKDAFRKLHDHEE